MMAEEDPTLKKITAVHSAMQAYEALVGEKAAKARIKHAEERIALMYSLMEK